MIEAKPPTKTKAGRVLTKNGTIDLIGEIHTMGNSINSAVFQGKEWQASVIMTKPKSWEAEPRSPFRKKEPDNGLCRLDLVLTRGLESVNVSGDFPACWTMKGDRVLFTIDARGS